MLRAASASPSPPWASVAEGVGRAADDTAERGVEVGLAPVGVAPQHPVVHRRQPRLGERDGILRAGEAGLDEATEVAEIAAAPVRLALRRGGPDRVDGAQGVGHDGPPGGARGAPAVDLGEDDAGGFRGWHPRQPQTSARPGSARRAATSAR